MRKVVVGLLTVLLMLAGSQVTGASPQPPSHDFVAWHTLSQFASGRFESSAYPNPIGRPSIALFGQSGAWTSPVVSTGHPVDTINPSWQADTPSGSHLNIELKVRNSGRWSDWYQMGAWAFSDTPSFRRTSTNDQPDEFGSIFTDTYVNTTSGTVDAYQLRAELVASGNARPRVFQLAAQVAVGRTFTAVSPTTMTSTIDLPVPQFSQYTHDGEYPAFGGGGEAWCSPSSVAMVIRYYHTGPSAADIAALPPDAVFDAHGRVDGEVPFAALHIFDTAYDGTGNWPFNTAYAAAYGLNTAVRVFTSLRDIETLIKRGIPVVASLNWNNTDQNPSNDLPGAGTPSTPGHMLVVRGVTAQGDVIANDPATHDGNGDVRRVYPRLPFERQWINASNGTTYVIAPQ